MKESVLKRYPELTDGDVVLRDDGKGPYVEKWNSGKPKPTIEQIRSWVEDDAKLPKPKTEMELLKEQNEELNLQIIDLYETLIKGGLL